MNRSDEGRQVKPGLGRIKRPDRDDDGDADDVETAQEGLGPHAGPGDEDDDDDEAMDEKNVSASQGERPGHSYQGEDAEEASEARQKAGVMGQKGQRMKEPAIKGQDISDAEEDSNPARKVIKGRATPPGDEPEVDGAHQGTGHGREPQHFTNLGHGEREATISGAHQGQHGGSSDGGKTGSGFEAGGNLRKEGAKGPSGTKR